MAVIDNWSAMKCRQKPGRQEPMHVMPYIQVCWCPALPQSAGEEANVPKGRVNRLQLKTVHFNA
jgi:hypothetical protein